MNTTLTIKLPKDLRDAAKNTAGAVGLPLSTIIHRQLRDFVEKGEITFVAPVSLRQVSSMSLPSIAKKKLRAAKRMPNEEFLNL